MSAMGRKQMFGLNVRNGWAADVTLVADDERKHDNDVSEG